MDETVNIVNKSICFLMLIVSVDSTIYLSVKDKAQSQDANFGSDASLLWTVMGVDPDEFGDPSENFTLSFFFVGDHFGGRKQLICHYDSETLHTACSDIISNRNIRADKQSTREYGFAIPHVNSLDAGYYECEYNSLAEKAEKAQVYLNITGIPSPPRVAAEHIPYVGKTTHLTCVPGILNRTEDSLPLRYTWYIDGHRIDPSNPLPRHVINDSNLYISNTSEEDQQSSCTCVIQERNNSQIYGPSEPYVISSDGAVHGVTSTSVKTPDEISENEHSSDFLTDHARMVIGIVPAVLGIVVCALIVLGTFMWRNRIIWQEHHLKHLKFASVAMATNTTTTLCATGGANNIPAGFSLTPDPANYRNAGSCIGNIYESVSMDDVLGPEEVEAYRRRARNCGAVGQLSEYDDVMVAGKGKRVIGGFETDYEDIHPVSTLKCNPKFGFSLWFGAKAKKVKQKAESRVTQQKVQHATISKDCDMDDNLHLSSLNRVSRWEYDTVAVNTADTFPRGNRARYSLQREIGGNKPGQLMYKYAYDDVLDACTMEQRQNEVNDDVDSCMKVSLENLVVDNGRYQTQIINEYREVNKQVKRQKQDTMGDKNTGEDEGNNVTAHPSLENLTFDNHSYGDM